MLTAARLDEGQSLEEVAARDWPVNRSAVLETDGGRHLSEEDRTFFRSLRPCALTAVILCIDR